MLGSTDSLVSLAYTLCIKSAYKIGLWISRGLAKTWRRMSAYRFCQCHRFATVWAKKSDTLLRRCNFSMWWANSVKVSPKWRTRPNLTENNVKTSLFAVILDLRVADRCVQFWVTQGLGSEFHFEIARAAALSGLLFSWHYGPYSLKNDFMAKTCFSWCSCFLKSSQSLAVTLERSLSF